MTANRASVLPVSHRLGAESSGFHAEMSSPPLAPSERRAESNTFEININVRSRTQSLNIRQFTSAPCVSSTIH
ncbi:hypothetical protein IG631_23155 [Alternaria alternata]|nr:hypothetical protein IG631_23155 [Alternaria alternata]